MKYPVDAAFEGYLTAVSSGKVPSPPAYLIAGKEEWQRKVAEEFIRTHLQLHSRRSIRWRGGEITERQLNEELSVWDLFGDERLLYIEEGENLNREVQKRLIAYLPRREKTLLLLIVAPTLAPTSLLYKALDEHGIIVTAEALRPRDKEAVAERWLIARCQADGKKLTPSAARLLFRQLGFNYDLLSQELDKLITYVGTRATIEDADVTAIAQVVSQDASWQLSDLLLQNDYRGALALGLRLLNDGTALIALVRQIRRQLQMAFEISTLPSEEIARRYPQLRDFMIERHRKLANSYGSQKLSAALCSLDSCELSFKNGCDDGVLLFTQLVLRLSGGIVPSLKLPLGASHVL